MFTDDHTSMHFAFGL